MHIVTNRKRALHKGTVLFLVLVLLFTGCSLLMTVTAIAIFLISRQDWAQTQ